MEKLAVIISNYSLNYVNIVYMCELLLLLLLLLLYAIYLYFE